MDGAGRTGEGCAGRGHGIHGEHRIHRPHPRGGVLDLARHVDRDPDLVGGDAGEVGGEPGDGTGAAIGKDATIGISRRTPSARAARASRRSATR
ncbi:hypothetical protein ACRAWC_23015 [Leifsonia sp. L25]|uniref:hypothetical protein n=1 Tax=Leifsonia sp. L25 TaxID=3423957 RepID=UPI003D68423C